MQSTAQTIHQYIKDNELNTRFKFLQSKNGIMQIDGVCGSLQSNGTATIGAEPQLHNFAGNDLEDSELCKSQFREYCPTQRDYVYKSFSQLFSGAIKYKYVFITKYALQVDSDVYVRNYDTVDTILSLDLFEPIPYRSRKFTLVDNKVLPRIKKLWNKIPRSHINNLPERGNKSIRARPLLKAAVSSLLTEHGKAINYWWIGWYLYGIKVQFLGNILENTALPEKLTERHKRIAKRVFCIWALIELPSQEFDDLLDSIESMTDDCLKYIMFKTFCKLFLQNAQPTYMSHYEYLKLVFPNSNVSDSMNKSKYRSKINISY